MDVVLHGFPEHEFEMGTLGAVAIVVRAFVVRLCHRHVEHPLRPLYLRGYFRQIRYLQRSPVLVDYVHHVDVVKIEFPILYMELILRKFKGLLNQIDVLVFHFSLSGFVTLVKIRQSVSCGYAFRSANILHKFVIHAAYPFFYINIYLKF